MATIKELLFEFRRRKIGQTLIVYLGSAWVLLEAFGFFAQRYGWDQRLFDAFLVLLFFGLPAAILVRWFQDADVASTKRRQIYLHSANFMLAIAFVVQTWDTSSHIAGEKRVKPEKSVAVLPFTNLSRDPDQEYFSDGITEDIISKLYKIGNLHVTSRTSVLMYKNTTKTIGQIADELGVSYVLEGSVRRANNKVRIIARLIRAGNDSNVWTSSFDSELSDVFQVQSEVAQKIAEGLKITLTESEQDRIRKAPTTNTLAYEYYQQGLFYTHSGPSLENVEKSKHFFERAIREDPNFAAAYTGLAETYITFMDWGYAAPGEVLPSAQQYAQKALQLDSLSGEAYAAIGAYHIYSTHDYITARESLEKAIALNPANDVVYYRYTILDWSLRQKEPALQHITKAIELNPLSLRSNAYRVQTYYLFRDYKTALRETERLLTIFPGDNFLLWLRGNIYTQLHDYPKAIDSFLQRSVATKDTNWALGYAYAKAGQLDKARKIAEYLIEKSKTHYIPPSFIAVIFLAMNDRDQALAFFEKAGAVNDYWLTTFDLEPWFDAIREDHRFKSIQNRLLFNNGIPREIQ
jgi:adenylate cyclase